ncbi:MAG: LuxR C-terminal-related transcriptional regulator [Verrucomicrobiaceae bacterium]
MAAWLEFQEIKHTIEAEFFIGRHKSNQLCLDMDGVSRRHALVYPQNGAYYVSDLGSTNGVLINGVRIRQPTELSDKDDIQLGNAALLFRWPGQRASRREQQQSSGFVQQTALVKPSLGAGNRMIMQVDESLRLVKPEPAWHNLMRQFFREPSDSFTGMPPRMHVWLRATTAALTKDASAKTDAFIVEDPGGRLVVRCVTAPASGWFLLVTLEAAVFEPAMLQSLGLSDREAGVMKWLAEGKTNAEIADLLGITTSTVNKHVESILKKLGVENRAQAIREVIERVGRG